MSTRVGLELELKTEFRCVEFGGRIFSARVGAAIVINHLGLPLRAQFPQTLLQLHDAAVFVLTEHVAVEVAVLAILHRWHVLVEQMIVALARQSRRLLLSHGQIVVVLYLLCFQL